MGDFQPFLSLSFPHPGGRGDPRQVAEHLPNPPSLRLLGEVREKRLQVKWGEPAGQSRAYCGKVKMTRNEWLSGGAALSWEWGEGLDRVGGHPQ